MRELLAVIGLVFFVGSCGGGGEKPAAAKKSSGFPEWVEKGTGAFSADKSRIFRGVGSASGIKNAALARTTSDNRARAEIAKIFETYSASLMKDYMASTTAGDMKASSEEQHVEQAVKTFSAVTLSGVQIVNHFVAPDGTWYALAELDVASFKDSIDKANELSAKVRDYVKKNAERAHADLDKEEAKRQAPPPVAERPAPQAVAPAPAPVAEAPAPAAVTPFGSTVKIEGALRGRIYFLPEGTSKLPEFGKLSPVGEVWATRIDVPARRFDTGFPGITERFEWFAVRYEGTVTFGTGGAYRFRVLSDDGAKVYVDGKLLADNDGVHPSTSANGEVQLTAGPHELALEYFQGPRYEIALQLFVTPPGGSEGIFDTTTSAQAAAGKTGEARGVRR